jgi:tRNA(fMet)-specific endonuclease VapC
MKQHPAAVARTAAYLAEHGQLTFSIITRYEILRGLAAKRAVPQLAAFERLCSACTILPLTDAAIIRAADIYADLNQQGLPLGDADILIAATALVNDLMVVTNNENHFSRIAGLAIDNWLK